MLIRISVIQLLDVNNAGFFQSVWSVANYMNIIMAGFGFYFLPAINSFVNSKRLNDEISKNLSMLLHLILPILLLILVFPSYLLKFLYTVEFSHLHYLLAWMAFGKMFEIIYLFFIIVLEAQGKLKIYINMELMRAAIFAVVPYMLIIRFGLDGAVAGIVLTNITTLFILLFLIRSDKSLILGRDSTVRLIKIAIGAIAVIFIPYLFLKIAISLVAIITILDIRNYSKLLILVKERIK